jgi:predicted patatin/cPLA2 family phospholipase
VADSAGRWARGRTPGERTGQPRLDQHRDQQAVVVGDQPHQVSVLVPKRQAQAAQVAEPGRSELRAQPVTARGGRHATHRVASTQPGKTDDSEACAGVCRRCPGRDHQTAGAGSTSRPDLVAEATTPCDARAPDTKLYENRTSGLLLVGGGYEYEPRRQSPARPDRPGEARLPSRAAAGCRRARSRRTISAFGHEELTGRHRDIGRTLSSHPAGRPPAGSRRRPSMYVRGMPASATAPPVSAGGEPRMRHDVARVLWNRTLAKSRPGGRSDDCRVGLAIEGGGVRGVVSAGMLVALEQLGLRDAIDAVYGSSAGALNATYFLTSGASTALALYYDELVVRQFIDPRRALRCQPIVSIEWVLEGVMGKVFPLDWEGVVSSPIPLHVIASSLTELKTVSFTGFNGVPDLKTALTASARIPFVAGPPVPFQGHDLLDASVLQAHPYETAIADRCTHVLALSTRPRGRLRPPPSVVDRLMSWRLDRLRPGLGPCHLERVREYRRAQERLLALTAEGSGPPFVLDITPSATSAEVRQLERGPTRILAGARAGYEAAMLALTGQPVHAILQLQGLPG